MAAKQTIPMSHRVMVSVVSTRGATRRFYLRGLGVNPWANREPRRKE
jgi:hypothetical protein